MEQQFHHQRRRRGAFATVSIITSVFNIYLLYVQINTDSSGLITASSERNFSSCMSCQVFPMWPVVISSLSVCVICVFSLWSDQSCSGEVWPDGVAVAPLCGSGEQDWSRTAAEEPPVSSAERSEVLRYR